MPLFVELNQPDLMGVAKAAEENLYPDDQLIAAQGDPGGELHVVVRGEIEVRVADSDDRLDWPNGGLEK